MRNTRLADKIKIMPTVVPSACFAILYKGLDYPVATSYLTELIQL